MPNIASAPRSHDRRLLNGAIVSAIPNVAKHLHCVIPTGTLLGRDRDGVKQLTLTFSGDERPDWLNFVLKDGNSWYDNKGTNFHVPLRAGATTTAEPQRQQQVHPDLSQGQAAALTASGCFLSCRSVHS